MSPGTPSNRSLTLSEARDIFTQLAAASDIAYRYRFEGCECRAFLMVERLLALGVEVGRAWAVSVDRLLIYRNPRNPKQRYQWYNHVAPVVRVEGVAHNRLVIDPSTQTEPATVEEWAGAMGAPTIEVSEVGLTQAAILERQRLAALAGSSLTAMVFLLPLGEPPILDAGGTGFRIGSDPPQGVAAFCAERMQRYLLQQEPF